MEKNKSRRTDQDIVSDFDHLFDEIPEPRSQEEISEFLIETGYDIEELKANGITFINNLIANNWRFVDIQSIREEAAKINDIPIHKDWNHDQFIIAIKKLSSALSAKDRQMSLAFRDLNKMDETDLGFLLQELEFEARNEGIEIDSD